MADFIVKSAIIVYGVPETIRTSDPFLRREVLYPAELRGQKKIFYSLSGAHFQALSPVVLEGEE